ncbi:MAG: hypothetical protein WC464_08015 [Bdellovibrionales bacterium]
MKKQTSVSFDPEIADKVIRENFDTFSQATLVTPEQGNKNPYLAYAARFTPAILDDNALIHAANSLAYSFSSAGAEVLGVTLASEVSEQTNKTDITVMVRPSVKSKYAANQVAKELNYFYRKSRNPS